MNKHDTTKTEIDSDLSMSDGSRRHIIACLENADDDLIVIEDTTHGFEGLKVSTARNRIQKALGILRAENSRAD